MAWLKYYALIVVVFGNGMAEPIADLVVSISDDYEHIIAPANEL